MYFTSTICSFKINASSMFLSLRVNKRMPSLMTLSSLFGSLFWKDIKVQTSPKVAWFMANNRIKFMNRRIYRKHSTN